MEKEKKINWEQNFLHPRIVSAVKRVEFISDRISEVAGVISLF